MTYAPGDAVRLKFMAPPGHVRTPFYLRGRRGVIERDLGLTGDAEALAYRKTDGPRVRLYRVRFSMAEVWGEAAETPEDTLDAEIFGTWLEPADAP